MKRSPACDKMVQNDEGMCLAAYLCPAGIPTIGFGSTKNVHLGTQITVREAYERYNNDMTEVENTLSAILPRNFTPTQGQWDALCSLCFNLAGGPQALVHKAPKLWNDLCTGQTTLAADEFLDMDHALVNGKMVELSGLKTRRQTERTIFLDTTWTGRV